MQVCVQKPLSLTEPCWSVHVHIFSASQQGWENLIHHRSLAEGSAGASEVLPDSWSEADDTKSHLTPGLDLQSHLHSTLQHLDRKSRETPTTTDYYDKRCNDWSTRLRVNLFQELSYLPVRSNICWDKNCV